jgi:hypothetical protein
MMHNGTNEPEASSYEAYVISLPMAVSLSDGKYDKRLDVFVMGCLLHYCFTGGQHAFGAQLYLQPSNIVQGQSDLSGLDHLPMHQALVRRMLAKVSCHPELLR